MWTVICILIIGFIVYKIKGEYEEHVEENVTREGGMLIKYELLIEYLKENGDCKVIKTTKDSVELASKSVFWTLDFVGNNLEIEANCEFPFIGKNKKKWTFPGNFSQKAMIQEIEVYMEKQIEQVANSISTNKKELLDDFIVMMANSQDEDDAKQIFENYIYGNSDLNFSKERVEAIIRKKMEEDIEDAMNGEFKDNKIWLSVTPDATVDYFMYHDNLRFKCGMSQNEFKRLLESIADDIKEKYGLC